eukprot:12443527-Alexandrium_andersonii.AAC.1
MPAAPGERGHSDRGHAARTDHLHAGGSPERESWQTQHLRSLGLRGNGSARSEQALEAVRLAAAAAGRTPGSPSPEQVVTHDGLAPAHGAGGHDMMPAASRD